MHIFYSGVGKGVIEMDSRLGSPRYRLFSCHGAYYKYAQQTSPLVATIDQDYEIMLDSGAFTAWTKGEEVKLTHLLRDYEDLVNIIGDLEKVWMINLDKIPGEKGRTASPKEVIEAIRISDENFNVLNEHFPGRVLPVFHQNESDTRLEEVCRMSDYICVSPRNDMAETYRIKWSSEVHAKIANINPNVRTHGLAATGYTMMTRVPWHSVDSATWIAIAAYGGIFVNEKLNIRGISQESPTRHEIDQHYDNLSDPQKAYLNGLMEEWDLPIEGLQSKFEDRALWNRLMMTQLYRGIDYKQAALQDGLFAL